MVQIKKPRLVEGVGKPPEGEKSTGPGRFTLKLNPSVVEGLKRENSEGAALLDEDQPVVAPKVRPQP